MGAGGRPDKAVTNLVAKHVEADAPDSACTGQGVWAFRVGKWPGSGRTGDDAQRCGIDCGAHSVFVYDCLHSVSVGETVPEKAVGLGGFTVVPYVQPPVPSRRVAPQLVEVMP